MSNGNGNGRDQESPFQPKGAPTFAVVQLLDAYAHTGAYLVRPPGSAPRPARDVFNLLPGTPLGARPLGGYQPKSDVLIMYWPEDEHAYVLGTVPQSLSDSSLILPDSMVMRSCVGQFEDALHYSALSGGKTVAGNFSAGRPSDTLPGDSGWMNELGVAVWISKAMACLRASDAAKIEAFWGDDLLRLVGYNLETFTSGSDRFQFSDGGEYVDVERYSPFTWEAMGIAVPQSAWGELVGGELKAKSVIARHEPWDRDQDIIPRVTRLRGYLGDVDREILSVPNPKLPNGRERQENATVHMGVLDIHKDLNGSYALRSAKEVLFEKTILIPVPKLMRRPDDTQGDRTARDEEGQVSGYIPAGIDDYSMPEFVFGGEAGEGGEEAPPENAGIYPAQIFDAHSWLFNKYIIEGLNAHEKDWYLPNEEDLGTLSDFMKRGIIDPAVINIGHKFIADFPAVGNLTIDTRKEHTVRYYRSRSMFKMHDDGSVTIESGYGSQIHLNSSVFVTAPGDVWAQPGRSFVCWAPFDAILRAGNCADISAAAGDVRLKADRNMQVLCGNSGTGGMLFECKAEGLSRTADYTNDGARVQGHGITFKALGSSVHSFARETHLGMAPGIVGRMTFDAGLGEMVLLGAGIRQRARAVASTTIKPSDTAPDAQSFALTTNGSMLSGPLVVGEYLEIAPGDLAAGFLFVGGSLVVHGTGRFKESVVTNGSLAQRIGGNFVGELEEDLEFDPSADKMEENLKKSESDLLSALSRTLEVVTADGRPGNFNFPGKIGFSFRDTEQDLFLDSSFVIYESRWQQLFRVSGVGNPWLEPEVESPNGQPTRPHPGQKGWATDEAYATVELKNFDMSEGRSKNRATIAEGGKEGNPPDKATLEKGYKVTVPSAAGG